MGSIIGHKISYNGVGVLRCQWHIPSINLLNYPTPPPELSRSSSGHLYVQLARAVLHQFHKTPQWPQRKTWSRGQKGLWKLWPRFEAIVCGHRSISWCHVIMWWFPQLKKFTKRRFLFTLRNQYKFLTTYTKWIDILLVIIPAKAFTNKSVCQDALPLQNSYTNVVKKSRLLAFNRANSEPK